jgi:hypothetical protein
MKNTPAFIASIYARRHRLRIWLWAALGVLLLSGLIQLSHNHDAHASLQDTHECVVCQHAQQLDKVLPLCIALVALLLVFVSLMSAATPSRSQAPTQHSRIRAPPAQR